MKYKKDRVSCRRAGNSLVIVLLVVSSMAVLSLSMIAFVSASGRQAQSKQDVMEAFYASEAAIHHAVADLGNGGTGALGSSNAPIGFGTADYFVESNDLGDGLVSLTATGFDDRATSRIQLVVRRLVDNPFTWGAFGDESLHMDSNARVDSYDSTLGSYASQEVNGNGSNSYANTNGTIGSNGNILCESNSKVYGDAHAGPSGTTSVVGNAVVTGSTTPSSSLVAMPAINVPVFASAGDLTLSGGSTMTIGPGDLAYDAFTLDSNATLNVVGPATLVLDSATLESNSEMWIDATNGPVQIYVRDDFVLNSNTLISSTTYTPADVEIQLLSDNVIDPNLQVDLDEVDFDSNAQLFGTIYAPHAAIAINSNFELFGAVVARSLDLDSNCKIHYDEALAGARAGAGVPAFESVCWNVLPIEEEGTN